MHRQLPTPAERIGVWLTAVLIFTAPALVALVHGGAHHLVQELTR